MKMGMVCVGIVRVSMHLKEQQAWATDKQLRVTIKTYFYGAM